MTSASASARASAEAIGTYAWQRSIPATASAQRRTAAFLLDEVIVFVLAWTFTFTAATAGLLRIPDVEFLGVRSPIMGLLWVTSIFDIMFGLAYFTFLEGTLGSTPGKMVLRLRVRHVDGTRVGMFDSFLRNLLRFLWVTPFGPAFILLDAWSLRVTELDQRMGDLAAETVVLDDRLRERL